MKLDKRIKTYNKKYQKELEDALRIIEPYLIQAFTSFYGEEYYQQIAYVIQNMKYTYFLSKNFFSMLVKLSKGICHKDYEVAKCYLKYLKQFDSYQKSIQNVSQLEKESFDVLVLKSDFDFYSLVFSDFLSYVSAGNPVYTTFCDWKEEHFYKSIFLPIFVIDFDIIVHEMNHAFMTDVLLVTDHSHVAPYLFINEETEELFNEFIAQKILKIYRKQKGPVPYALKRFELANDLKYYFRFIDTFYYCFEKVIKKSIMNQNFNLLWEYAGKEDFCLFCSLVQKYYLQGGCSEEQFNELNNLVLKMNEHAFTIENYDYENLFQKLESMGYRVRRLK